MTKQLFLSLLACMLVIVPGYAKQTVAPEQMTSEQLEKERKSYTLRGVVLMATSPIVCVAGGLCAFAGLVLNNGFHKGSMVLLEPTNGIPVIAVGGAIMAGGLYMFGKGIYDLAQAQTLRFMQTKRAAQQRRLARGMKPTEGYAT